jgi:hypothetical protein
MANITSRQEKDTLAICGNEALGIDDDDDDDD